MGSYAAVAVLTAHQLCSIVLPCHEPTHGRPGPAPIRSCSFLRRVKSPKTSMPPTGADLYSPKPCCHKKEQVYLRGRASPSSMSYSTGARKHVESASGCVTDSRVACCNMQTYTHSNISHRHGRQRRPSRTKKGSDNRISHMHKSPTTMREHIV